MLVLIGLDIMTLPYGVHDEESILFVYTDSMTDSRRLAIPVDRVHRLEDQKSCKSLQAASTNNITITSVLIWHTTGHECNPLDLRNRNDRRHRLRESKLSSRHKLKQRSWIRDWLCRVATSREISHREAFHSRTNCLRTITSQIQNNPLFSASTTRLEIFDAVAAECHKQQILIHLDNHQSKAEWCCGTADGQSWFGDTNFPIENWKRGLAYMAEHAKAWPAL